VEAGATQHAVATLHQEFRLGEGVSESADSSALSAEKVPARK
jgi:hypothetical protein